MSKLHKFLIIFDNPSLLYFPGQFLTGKVLIELEEDTPFVGLYFHVVGEGCIRLRSRGQERIYDKENYIDFRLRLLGETGQAPVLLSSGIHSFPFKLGLPLGLPSTFLGKYGWVQFFCKATLREPNGLIHKNQQVFILMNPIDLNLEPASIGKPVHREAEHILGGSSCVKSGRVICRVRLNKSGFVPGERIHIWARIDNQSRTGVRSTQAVLTETIQYTSRGKILQTEQRDLSTFSKGKVKPNGKDEWVNEKLLIPPLPPTNLRGCHLIRIQYDVFFIIHPSGFDKKVKIQLPVTIATYPIREGGAEDGGGGGVDGQKSGSGQEKFPSILPIYRPNTDKKPINNNIM